MIDTIASNPLMRSIVSVGVFALAMFLSLVVGLAIARRVSVRRELQGMLAKDGGLARVIASETLSTRGHDAWERLVARIERAGLTLTDTHEHRLRRTLRAAGYESPMAPRVYSLLRLISVVVFPLVFVLFVLGTGRHISFFALYAGGCFWAAVGLYLPGAFLRIQIDRRRTAIVNGFPDCLDLLLICVEAGYGMEAALDRVSREMVLLHPVVTGLLAVAVLRQRAGASREEALRQLAEEADVDEVRSFVTLMIQSDKLGTSIATTLRVYASGMRERRRLRAEERAHRIPVLISIPLVTCMLPVMIGVLMLPAFIIAIRKVIPAMTGAGG